MMLSVSDINRFLAKVDKADECWLWTARKNYKGYGMFRLGSRVPYAHRVAYEHYVGPIPEGLQLDHICRVRHCVNPDHLEPVTNAETTCTWTHGEAGTAERAGERKPKHGEPSNISATATTSPNRGSRVRT
jgi:hypothetical protein